MKVLPSMFQTSSQQKLMSEAQREKVMRKFGNTGSIGYQMNIPQQSITQGSFAISSFSGNNPRANMSSSSHSVFLHIEPMIK